MTLHKVPAHPEKELSLEEALKNVKHLPKEIRAMVSKANSTMTKKQLARMHKHEKDEQERKNLFLHAHTTHGAQFIVKSTKWLCVSTGAEYDDAEQCAAAECPKCAAPDAFNPTKYPTLDKVRNMLNENYMSIA